MASYTIEVKETSNEAKHFIQFIEDYAKKSPYVSIKRVPNATTRKAINDAINGKVYTAKSAKELINSIK